MPFLKDLFGKNDTHSQKIKNNSPGVIRKEGPAKAKPARIARKPVGQGAKPTKENLSHRLSRPFDTANFGFMYAATPQQSAPRPRTSAAAQADVLTGSLRPSPARPVTAHTSSMRTHAPQYGHIETVEPQPSHRVSPKTTLPSLSSKTYPQSVESLYIQCGIITARELAILSPRESNAILQAWATHNPVAALHIIALARKWNLHFTSKYTFKLTDAADSPTRRGLTPDHNPHNPVRVHKLPLAATQLYADVAELDMRTLSEGDVHDVLSDWVYRFPVSDHHLQRVVERWAPLHRNVGPILPRCRAKAARMHRGQ